MRMRVQRFRRAIEISLLWAGTWAIAGPLLALGIPGEVGWGLPRLDQVLWTALSCSIAGALGGSLFAIFLASDKRRRIEAFSVPYVALHGAISGVVVPATIIALRG